MKRYDFSSFGHPDQLFVVDRTLGFDRKYAIATVRDFDIAEKIVNLFNAETDKEHGKSP